MKITPYTHQELEIKRKNTQDKLLELKANLKSIRDLAELPQNTKSDICNDGTGENIDTYV